jgi:hypothetical protein
MRRIIATTCLTAALVAAPFVMQPAAAQPTPGAGLQGLTAAQTPHNAPQNRGGGGGGRPAAQPQQQAQHGGGGGGGGGGRHQHR